VELKPGYKQTEVGVIPEEWEAKTIDQVGFVTSGKRLPLGCSLVEHPTPHPYVRVTDMRPGTVSLSEIKFVPESVFPAIKRYRIFCEDIFISVAGTLGIVGKVPKELDGANLTENADRITNITCSQDYLLHVLMSPLIQNKIDSIQTVGAQPKLALTRIRKFAIPSPLLPEQRAIAGALSDVDELIGALDQLIVKKRDLKQAAMKQLLTGQTRLPGFRGKWERRTIAQIAPLQRGFDLPTSNLKPGNFPVVYSNGVLNYHADCMAKGPGVVTGRSGTIGKVTYVERDYWPHNTSLWVTSFKGNHPKFIFYLYTAIGFERFGTGSGVPTLNRNDVHSFELDFPNDPAEQSAITTVLSDMDAEIAALEQRRNKIRDLKQGMMQELLTGRTRLV